MKGLNEWVHQQFHMEKVPSQQKFVLPFELKKPTHLWKSPRGRFPGFELCQFLFYIRLVWKSSLPKTKNAVMKLSRSEYYYTLLIKLFSPLIYENVR